MIDILYKSQNLIIVNKPPFVSSQSDKGFDKDAMTLCSEELSKNGENSDLWIIQRLDKVVGGVLCFARNKRYAALLSEALKNRNIEKEYFAVLDGESDEGIFIDYIYKDTKKSRSFVVESNYKGAKKAVLSCKKLGFYKTEKGVKTLVKVKLETGRFHQIRTQFSNRDTPITGDGKYGSHDSKAESIALFACRISFSAGDEKIDLFTVPDLLKYPWSLFSKDLFI